MSNIQLIHGDCLEVIKTISTESIAAIIADPPYGWNLNPDYSKYPGGKKYKKIIGDEKPFDFSFWRNFPCKEQFWFGAENYSNLPPAGCWFCWDKYPTDKSDGRLSGAFELIWSRHKHTRKIIRVKAINTSWVTVKESVGHPTQKPVALFAYLIEKFTKPGDIVLDPYMGSGSCGVACVMTNRNYIGIEIQEDNFTVSTQRIEEAQAKLALVGA